jgi:hypothetical protein
MKTCFAAALAAVAIAAPAHAQTTNARLPFAPTPAAFKAFINQGSYGLKIQALDQCSVYEFPAEFRPGIDVYKMGKTKSYWMAHRVSYECEQVFYEVKDPRGTQRCMGKVWFVALGTTPQHPKPSQSVNQRTLKNDCRWVG